MRRFQSWPVSLALLTGAVAVIVYAVQPPVAGKTAPAREDTPEQRMAYRVLELEREVEILMRERTESLAKAAQKPGPVKAEKAKPAAGRQEDEQAYAETLEDRAK